MNRPLQNALLAIYRTVFARGLLRLAWGRRLFYALYDLYKTCFEAGPVDQLRRFVPEDGFVIDVGANIGFFTMRFARWVGPAGTVVAIEPEAENFRELVRRVNASGLSRQVKTIAAVADAASGEAHLVINPDHPGDHRLGDEGLPVAAVTIDAISEGRTPALIKIDVQGAEAQVLAGAERTLQRVHPVLFIEIDPQGLARFGSSVSQIFERLGRFGYVPHVLEKEGPPRRLPEAERDALIAQRGYADILFIVLRQVAS
jgi:FkbM family methyltransferase